MAKMSAAAGGNLAKQIGGISGSLDKLKKALQQTDLGKSIRTMKLHAIRTADQLSGKKVKALSRSAKRSSATTAASIGRQLGGAVLLGRKVRAGAKASWTGTNSPSARFQRANQAFSGWAGQKATQFAGWRKTTGEKLKTTGMNAQAKIKTAIEEYRVNRKFNALMKKTEAQMKAQQAAQAQQVQQEQTYKLNGITFKKGPSGFSGMRLKKRKPANMLPQQAQQAQQAVQAVQQQAQPMTKLQAAIKRQVINRKFHALMRKTAATMQAQQAAQGQQPQSSKKGMKINRLAPGSWIRAMKMDGEEKKEKEKPKSLMTQISEKLTAFSKWLEQFGLAPQQIFAKTIGAAANLEKQMILMEQSVKENTKKFTPEQVTQATKDYMAALRKNAVLNPFSVDEVTSGGMKALKIAKGDTTKAMSYMSIAENVAALKGEKLESVIDAFADAQKGDMSKINAFGFTFAKKDVRGKKGYDRMLAKVDKQFAGGSAKMGGTALGLWESIQEGFSVAMQDSGVEALERLKPQLKRLQEWLTESGGGFDKLKEFAIIALEKITDGFLYLVKQGEKLFPIFQEIWTTYVSPVFEAIGWGIKWLIYNFEDLKPYLLGIATAFSAFMIITKVIALVSGLIAAFSSGGAVIAALSNPIGWVAAAIGLLAVAWQKNWGGIREKMAAVIEWLKPYLAQAIAFVQDKFAKLSQYFASIWPPLEVFITKAMPTIMVYLNALWESFKMVFGGIFDLFKTWVTLIWNTVTSILELLGGLFKALIEWASGDTEKAMQTLKDTFWGFLEDLASLATDLQDGLGTFLKNLMSRSESGVQTLIKVRTEEEQKSREKLSQIANPPPKYPQPIDMLGPTNSTPQPSWLQPTAPASSPFLTQPQTGDSALATLLQRGTSPGSGPKLSPAEKATIFNSSSSGASASQRGGNQVHVAQLVGEVHIHNDADQDLFMKKLQRHLELGLGLEGSGVGVG